MTHSIPPIATDAEEPASGVFDDFLTAVSDLLGEPVRYRPSSEEPDETTVACVVECAGRPMGWLELDSSLKSVEAPSRSRLESAAKIVGRLLDLSTELRQRVAELDTVSRVSTAVAGLDRVDAILDSALRAVIEVMGVAAGAIRLWRPDSDELELAVSVNMSRAYFDKGPVLAGDSGIDVQALSGEIVYVEDLRADSRVRFPEIVEREGIRSLLCAGMRFRGQPVGVIRLYTKTPRAFTSFEKSLVRTAAQQVATAIVNTRLIESQRAARATRRQLELAAEVQQRMLPQRFPTTPGLDIAARCVPSLEVGGDFYDFVEFGPSVGVGVGDVVGKGVPAALLMASVRASLRAHALDVYDLDQVIARTNRDMVADTLYEEFATLWYGVIDRRSLRLTYCNAGHEPTLLVRPAPGGFDFRELSVGGMVIGIERELSFRKEVVELRPGDTLVAVSDGLPEALDFESQAFGKQRVRQAIVDWLTMNPDGQATGLVNHLLWEVRRFVGLNQQSDDMTVVVVRIASDYRV
ncbi:MAG: PP2C family protein-serine/threonine phosphatase [Phycisphaerales bacterium]